MSDQPPFAEYPRPDQGGGFVTSGRGPGVYFDAIGEAWNLVLKDLGHWIAATIVFGVIVIALRLPIMIFSQVMMPANPRADQLGQVIGISVIQMVVSLIPLAVQTVLTTGMIAMGVRKSRGEYINVGMMFEPFRRFGAVFSSGLLYGVIVVAATLACIFPVFFFSPILVLMPVVAFIKGVGALESLSLTFDRCKPYWASLLGLLFVLGLILFAGLILCGVGLLVAWPIYCVVLGIHYRAFFESEPVPAPVYP